MHTGFINIPDEEKSNRRSQALRALDYHMHNHVPTLHKLGPWTQTISEGRYRSYDLCLEGHKPAIYEYMRYFFDENNVVTKIEFIRSWGGESAVVFNVTRNEWAQDLMAKIMRPAQTKTENV